MPNEGIDPISTSTSDITISNSHDASKSSHTDRVKGSNDDQAFAFHDISINSESSLLSSPSPTQDTDSEKASKTANKSSNMLKRSRILKKFCFPKCNRFKILNKGKAFESALSFVVSMIHALILPYALVLFLLIYCFTNWWICVLYGGVCLLGALYSVSDHVMYQPDSPSGCKYYIQLPPSQGIQNFKSIFIKSLSGEVIHMYVMAPSPSHSCTESRSSSGGGIHKDRPTVLFFHGNSGHIGHRLQNVKSLFSSFDCTVCLIEYHSYGMSTNFSNEDGNTPSEPGIYQDAQSALDFVTNPDLRSSFLLKNRHSTGQGSCSAESFSEEEECLLSQLNEMLNPNSVIVFGRSLGGAVAIDLASKPSNQSKIRGVIVENTFTSIPLLAKQMSRGGQGGGSGGMLSFIPCLSSLIGVLPLWMYKNKFVSLDKIVYLTQPVLFLTGMSDQLIPPKMSEDLFAALSNPDKAVVNNTVIRRGVKFPGKGHNDTWLSPNYFHVLASFLFDIGVIKKDQIYTKSVSYGENSKKREIYVHEGSSSTSTLPQRGKSDSTVINLY